MKRTLVLGADGYLGKHLITHLQILGYTKIFTLGRRDIDLRDLDSCRRMFYEMQPDEIYQLAADSGNMQYILSKEHSYGDSTLININITKALTEFKYKGKILFPSTYYIYDQENRYGIEKKFNENLYLTTNFDVRIPRLFSVYGPGEIIKSPREKVTTALCRKFIQAADKVIIRGNPKQIRYFLYVVDAINGIISLMEYEHPLVLDLGGDAAITFLTMAKELEKLRNNKIKIHFTDDDKHEKEIIPFTKTAKVILGWKPTVTFKTGMEILYNWVKKELENELR
jgi:nucleoside-diphosphate-sugar epimerase